MAGIYIHIPFCRQACHYCNFHFSTSLKNKGNMVTAILKELEWQKNYLDGEIVETIYLGGGTPSLFDEADLQAVFAAIFKNSSVSPTPEITLEANPDDLNLLKIKALKQTPVNRLSIGIQSFSDEDLKFMNRAHNAGEALACLENVLSEGFENLTLDLIYGSPTTSDEQWERNLETAFQFNIPHLSCYCLTVEEKTALAHFIKIGKAPAMDEEKAARHFETLISRTASAGYEHYEISNFAKPGSYSKHNSSYWQGKKYLGIGPSAHSFDGVSRQWNVADNARYIQSIQNGSLLFEKEILTPQQRYNEYVMTSLRTMWGCDLEKIKEIDSSFEAWFLKSVLPFVEKKEVERSGDIFRLTQKGKLLADRIAMELFTDN